MDSEPVNAYHISKSLSLSWQVGRGQERIRIRFCLTLMRDPVYLYTFRITFLGFMIILSSNKPLELVSTELRNSKLRD